MTRLNTVSSKEVFCLTNSIRHCSLYVSVASLRQNPVDPFLHERKHPPDIFILETEEPWKVAAQQDREQVNEPYVGS